MIKRLLTSVFVGIIFIIFTYSFRDLANGPFGEVPVVFKVVNWSLPFWEYLYSDELGCSPGAFQGVIEKSCYTNGLLAAAFTYLILRLRARKTKLKLR